MHAPTAKTETHEAWLSTEFGESYARRIFGDAVVDALPRITRGKRTGAIAGKIVWLKVAPGNGGWSYSDRCVLRPGTHKHAIVDYVGKIIIEKR